MQDRFCEVEETLDCQVDLDTREFDPTHTGFNSVSEINLRDSFWVLPCSNVQLFGPQNKAV